MKTNICLLIITVLLFFSLTENRAISAESNEPAMNQEQINFYNDLMNNKIPVRVNAGFMLEGHGKPEYNMSKGSLVAIYPMTGICRVLHQDFKGGKKWYGYYNCTQIGIHERIKKEKDSRILPLLE